MHCEKNLTHSNEFRGGVEGAGPQGSRCGIQVSHSGGREAARLARQAVQTLSRHSSRSPLFSIASQSRKHTAQTGGSSPALRCLLGLGPRGGQCGLLALHACHQDPWAGEAGWIYFEDIHLTTVDTLHERNPGPERAKARSKHLREPTTCHTRTATAQHWDPILKMKKSRLLMGREVIPNFLSHRSGLNTGRALQWNTMWLFYFKNFFNVCLYLGHTQRDRERDRI